MSLARDLARSLGDFGRIVRAGGYSLRGLLFALRQESAFRQEVLLFATLAPVGLWLGQGGVEKVLLVGSLLLVLIVELLNSAVEAAIDRIGADRHELSGAAKDMGSAAVLIALLLAGFAWVAILWPRLWN
jgi:diacylglycerol kinase (ATP)